MASSFDRLRHDVGESEIERARHPRRIECLDKETSVVDLPPAVCAHEAPQLPLGRHVPLGGLPLEDAERSQLALPGDDLLDRLYAERADQLVLQVHDAREEAEALHVVPPQVRAEARPLETPPDGRLLAYVIEAGDASPESARTVALQIAANRLRAADGLDHDALGDEIATAPLGQSLERISVARPLDEHDGAGTRSRILLHVGSFAGWDDPA